MDEPSTLWDRLPGEPTKWFARFELYRDLGPSRSLDRGYRACQTLDHGLQGEHPGAQWREIAKRWSWKERAEAFDAEQRILLRTREEERRTALREERLSRIAEALDWVFAGLQAAELAHLDVERARRMFEHLTRAFMDLLAAQRLEMGEPSEISQASGDLAVRLTADDLAEASKALREWVAVHEQKGEDVDERDDSDDSAAGSADRSRPVLAALAQDAAESGPPACP